VIRLHVLHVPGADPQRDLAVRRLAGEAELCVHPDPERHGVVWNWATALTCAATDRGAWSYVVQDDVVPLRNWEYHAAMATRWSPSPMLALAWIGKRFDIGVQRRVAYVKGPYVLCGPAVAYHHSILEELAVYADAVARTDYPHDDMAACFWANQVGGFFPAVTSRTLFATLPVRSLVGHSRYTTGDYTIVNTPDLSWNTNPRFVMLNEHRDDSPLKAMGWVDA
jgi:hypothetical protein